MTCFVSSLQGLILSSFYWGYVLTHIPGGMLADKFGGKYTLGLGILSTAIFTLLTPVAVEVGGSTLLIILRFCMGLGEGTTFPALNAMLAHWSPPSERSRFGSLVFAGAQIGTVIANGLSGNLIYYLGWPSVFYFFGCLGVLWFVVFTLVCFNNPDEHPFISDKERTFLAESTKEHTNRKIPPVPWRYVLTSVPIWALVAAQIGHDWGLFTMVTDLPLYMSNVLHFSIRSNGYLSALPYIVMWLVSLLCSPVADWLINTGKMSRTNVRKLFTTTGSMGPAIFIIAASYAGCDRVTVVILFAIGMGFMGTYYPGMKVNSLDLTPNYAGTVMAIVNGIGAISGIITPYLVGILTPNETVGEWRMVFWIVFVVFTVTNIIYILYADGEIQSWNNPDFLNQEAERRKNKAAGEVGKVPEKAST